MRAFELKKVFFNNPVPVGAIHTRAVTNVEPTGYDPAFVPGAKITFLPEIGVLLERDDMEPSIFPLSQLALLVPKSVKAVKSPVSPAVPPKPLRPKSLPKSVKKAVTK